MTPFNNPKEFATDSQTPDNECLSTATKQELEDGYPIFDRWLSMLPDSAIDRLCRHSMEVVFALDQPVEMQPEPEPFRNLALRFSIAEQRYDQSPHELRLRSGAMGEIALAEGGWRRGWIAKHKPWRLTDSTSPMSEITEEGKAASLRIKAIGASSDFHRAFRFNHY